MRVYVPTTIAGLHKLTDTGELRVVNGTAFAVTPAFRESYATGGDEELEYAAMLDAARASLRLLAAELADDEKAMPRRVVVSADVENPELRPDLDFSVVRLNGPIPLRDVAAVHVDTEEAQDAVKAASEVIDKADLGDPDAEFTLGDAEDFELAWYATQELPFLLDLM